MLNSSFLKYILLVFMICELAVISIHMFSQGFLLTREIINHKSNCEDFKLSKSNKDLANYELGCWAPKKYKKAIVIIIDALRYDFTTKNNSPNKKKLYFENNMNIFEDLLSNNYSHGILVPFIADPPTTTMQRLKGLTTGSLPTFIDAGHNFASTEIMEDNLIDQWKQSGKKIVVLGDDTWGQLFPNRFHRSHLYPSFNVMDLDTVDNGILEHLYSEIQGKDWDIIIAHFLGVDHCGHRFGPNHPQMQRKLMEMNDVIRNVSSLLNQDSLLVVMGDHGMTSTGDHGGDSKEELEAALFVYSPLLNIPISKPSLEVSQIDIVPTLSFLLGVPVPYSNLGKVIETFFVQNDENFKQDSSNSQTNVLYVNMLQVHRYLESYQDQTNELPSVDWHRLKEIFKLLNGSSLSWNNDLIFEYFTIAKLMCIEIWAKFDISNMILGIFSLLCCIVLILHIVGLQLKKTPSTARTLLNFRYVVYLFLSINVSYGISYFTFSNSLNLICCLIYVWFHIMLFKIPLCFIEEFFLQPVFFFILLIVSVGSFSNSFVIVEDSVSSFFCSSLLGFLVLKYFVKKFNFSAKAKSFKNSLPFSFFDLLLLCCLIGVLICIRMSHLFWKCREEQYWCDASSLVHVSINNLPKEFHNARYVTSILPIIALIAFPQHWLQSCGNLNGWESGIFVARTIPVVSGLLLGGYWALQSVPTLVKDISKLAVLFPQLIYLTISLGTVIIFYNPLFIYILPPHKEPIGSSENTVIPQLFMKLKQKYEELSHNSRKTPIVYGLATSVSAPFVIFLELLLLGLMLLSGDGIVPGVCLLVITAVLCLGVHSLLTWKNADSADSLLIPNRDFIAIWFILSLYGFYATGHQPTFPTLNWSAAFVGYDGVGSYVIPAILMLLNTFSSHLLFAISLPLLLIIPLSIGFLWPSLRLNKPNCEDMTRGEFLLVEKSELAREAFLSSSLIYVMFHAIKVLFTSIAAFVLRRHLMVWKIFAPHFIFEAVGFLITCFGVLIGLTIVFRIITVLEKWSVKL